MKEIDDNSAAAALSRRNFLRHTAAALAAKAAASPLVLAQQPQKNVPRSPDHKLSNEQQVGPNNQANDALNPSSVWAPETDNGNVKPFKYSFDEAHKETPAAGRAK